MTDKDDAPFALQSVGRIVWRYWHVMALFFLATVALVAIATLLYPRSYRSQARLLLRLGRENTTLDPTVSLGQTVVAVPYTRELEINSALDILLSRALAEKVLEGLGPAVVLGTAPLSEATSAESDPRSEAWQQALELFRKNLNAEVVKKTSVLSVSFDAGSPEVAQAVLARIVALFQDRYLELSRPQGAFQFLATQAARLEESVRRTEEELRQKKTVSGLASPDTQRQLLANRLGRLEDELTQARASLAAAEAEGRSLEAQLEKVPAVHATMTTKGVANQAADQVRAQYALLKVREAEVVGRHGESHAEVKLVQRQITAVEEFLRKEEASREQITTGPNKLHEEAQLALQKQRANVAALKAREAAIVGQLKDEHARFAVFAAAELEVGRLQRRLDLETAQHRRYAEGTEQGQIDRALQSEKISNVAVVQPATYEPRHVRPRLLMNLVMAAAFGLVGAAALGTLLDFRSRGKDAGK